MVPGWDVELLVPDKWEGIYEILCQKQIPRECFWLSYDPIFSDWGLYDIQEQMRSTEPGNWTTRNQTSLDKQLVRNIGKMTFE